MKRRTVLAGCGALGSVALAGCTALFNPSLPDELEDVSPAEQLPRPTLGGGAVVVESYEDIGCPACQEFNADVFPDIETRHIESDAISYRHFDFVVMADDRSLDLACAARAVQADTRTDDDPNGAFFSYKRDLMTESDWAVENLAAVAAEHGADGEVVRTAVEEGTYYPQLRADWEQADSIGVTATPTLFVGDTEVDPFDVDEIDAEIEARP